MTAIQFDMRGTGNQKPMSIGPTFIRLVSEPAMLTMSYGVEVHDLGLKKLEYYLAPNSFHGIYVAYTTLLRRNVAASTKSLLSECKHMS
jgi:hypothetical protein